MDAVPTPGPTVESVARDVESIDARLAALSAHLAAAVEDIDSLRRDVTANGQHLREGEAD